MLNNDLNFAHVTSEFAAQDSFDNSLLFQNMLSPASHRRSTSVNSQSSGVISIKDISDTRLSKNYNFDNSFYTVNYLHNDFTTNAEWASKNIDNATSKNIQKLKPKFDNIARTIDYISTEIDTSKHLHVPAHQEIPAINHILDQAEGLFQDIIQFSKENFPTTRKRSLFSSAKIDTDKIKSLSTRLMELNGSANNLLNALKKLKQDTRERHSVELQSQENNARKQAFDEFLQHSDDESMPPLSSRHSF
jgi:hypothetical protein